MELLCKEWRSWLNLDGLFEKVVVFMSKFEVFFCVFCGIIGIVFCGYMV